MADRTVRWNRIVLPSLGIFVGLTGAILGLSRGATIALIIGACALLLGTEWLLLRAKESSDR